MKPFQLLKPEGAKPANHPQAFRDIRCVARIGRAMQQLFDRRVRIEAMAEKRSEIIGQLDRAIHQSVQLEIDHALDDLVRRRVGHRAWHLGKVRWCDLFRNEITAEQRIDGSRRPYIQIRIIVSRVQSGPGMPGLGGDVTGPGRAHESEVEYQEAVGSKNIADRHEMRSGVWRGNGKSRLDSDAHHVRLRQIPPCPADDLRVVPVTIDLDVVGRRDHALGEQSIQSGNRNLTQQRRMDYPQTLKVTGHLVKGTSVIRTSAAPYMKIPGSFFVAQRRCKIDLIWLLLRVQLFDNFGDRIEPIDANLVLEMFPARMGTSLDADVDHYERFFEQVVLDHPCSKGGRVIIVQLIHRLPPTLKSYWKRNFSQDHRSQTWFPPLLRGICDRLPGLCVQRKRRYSSHPLRPR